MMKIGLQTWGSEGDIRPFIALAGGLSARGHEVTLALTSVDIKDYTPYAKSLKFEIIHAHDTYAAWGADRLSRLKQDIIKTKQIDQVTRLYDDLLEPAVEEMYEVSRRLCDENDAVLGYFIVHPLQLAALNRDRPYATLVWSPDFFPSRHRAPSTLPDLGKWMNPGWWRLAGAITNRMILKYVNRLRAREGYPAANDVFSDAWQSKALTLIAASPTLFDRPADWGDHLQVCGFLAVPEEAGEWVMPEELRRFLDAGDPPVFMTFGSMPQSRPATELFIDAARAAGCRAIIQARWDAIPHSGEDPNIHRIGAAPHHEIFPYCSLVVHHGGAGTSHSASLAGCPSIVVEHFGDQIFWGAQLKRAGLTTKVLHARSVTSKILGAEIRNVLTSPAMKAQARRVAESMKKEDGVKRAVALIEERLAPH